MKPQLEQLEDRCCPSTFTVTSLADSGPGSLRAAVLQVNKDSGTNIVDTINIVAQGTIELQKPLTVTHHCTINGPGEDLLTINGQGKTRVWFIYPPNAADGQKNESAYLTTITGMTVENAAATDPRGFGGAGLFARENVCLEDMCFEDCSASTGGGAVAGLTSVMTEDCMFEGCSAGARGGAIMAPAAGLSISGSTFMGNKATYGGAVAAMGFSGKAVLTDDSFMNDTASIAAALYFEGAHDIVDASDCVFADYGNTGTVTIDGSQAPSPLPKGFPANEIRWVR